MSIWSRLHPFKKEGDRLQGRSTPEAKGQRDPENSGWRFIVRPSNTAMRYVLLNAVSPDGYPTEDDYILLARRPGDTFRAVYMVYVPFDEAPPVLLNFDSHPEVAVVYQNFTLAWTDDGGATIRKPSGTPEGLFPLWRFGSHGIDWVRVQNEFLYLRMVAGRHEQSPFVNDDRHAWRVRLDGSGSAELAELPQDLPGPSTKSADLVKVVGSRLMVRIAEQSPWMELSPQMLMEQLQKAHSDFFGGAGGRTLH